MAKALRHEIPESGERYDFTYVKGGQNSDGEEMAHFKIDNGDYAGHKVSARVRPEFNEWARRGETRLSARLTSTWRAKVGGTYQPVDRGHSGAKAYRITYRLDEYDDPEAEPEIKIRRTPNKFKRDVE